LTFNFDFGYTVEIKKRSVPNDLVNHLELRASQKVNKMKNSNVGILSKQFLKSQISFTKKEEYDERKRLNLQYSERVSTLFPEQHSKNDRLSSCSMFITREVFQHMKTQEYKSSVFSYSCKDPFCAVCQFKKSRRLFHEMYQSLEFLQSQTKKQYSYYLLTLTVKNPEISDLRDTVKLMRKSWREMAYQKIITKKQMSVYAPLRKVLRGYFSSLEYLGSKHNDGYAHPHFHIILVMPKSYYSKGYIKADYWRKMWQYALGVDYVPKVNIKRINPQSYVDENGIKKERSAMVGAISEVVKYSTKPTQLMKYNDDDLKEFIEQTKGIQTFTRSQYFRSLLDIIKNDFEIQRIAEEEEKQWRLLVRERYFFSNDLYDLRQSETFNDDGKVIRFVPEPHKDMPKSTNKDRECLF